MRANSQTEVNYLGPLKLGSIQCFQHKAVQKCLPLSSNKNTKVYNFVIKWSNFVKSCLGILRKEEDQ